MPVEAPAGSLLVMDGRIWHQSGINRTPDRHRAALFGYYVRSWIRPQVNWNVFLDPEVAASLSPEFLDLLGYRTGYVDLLGAPAAGAGAGRGRDARADLRRTAPGLPRRRRHLRAGAPRPGAR